MLVLDDGQIVTIKIHIQLYLKEWGNIKKKKSSVKWKETPKKYGEYFWIDLDIYYKS
jgi:hypothetical protein